MRRLPRSWREIAERRSNYAIGAVIFIMSEIISEAIVGWDPYRLISVIASSILFWVLAWYLIQWLLNRPPGGRGGRYA